MRKDFFTASTPILLLALGALPAYAGGSALPVTITIPCDSPPWLTCADLKKKLIDGEVATASGFPGGMKAVIREMLDDVYTQTVRFAKNLVNQADCTTFDNLNKPPLCSPLKIPENGCADESVNAYKVKTGSAKCPPISLVGAATKDHPLFSLGKSDLGSLESSNVSAALIMAISNQGADITSEIAKNALTIQPTSPCYARASTLQQLIANQSDVQLIAKINACDPNDQTQNCSAKEYFKGTVTTILSGYVQLAKCRLSDESTAKFIAFTTDPGSPMKPYTDVLRDLFIQQCFYPNQGNPAAMRACYAQRYDAWIKARARAAFPNVAAACP